MPRSHFGPRPARGPSPGGAAPRPGPHTTRSRFLLRSLVPIGLGAVLCAVLGAVLGAAFLPSPAAARKEYRAESYRVTLQVEPDGAVRVREEIRVRFEGGPFTFFYRGIPTSRTDGIDQVEASDSIQVRVRKERVDVTWRFPSCRDTIRDFELEYLARGVLYNEGEQRRLRWRLYPAERAYPIDAASATVVFPPGTPAPVAARIEPGDVAFAPTRESVGGPAFELAPTPLRPNRSVVVEVDLPAGAHAGADPGWRMQRIRWRERLPGMVAVAAVVLALGLLWVTRLRADLRTRLAPGTAEARVGRVGPPVSAPPGDVSPGLSGALVLGQPALPHAFAVLLDLARQGAVRIDAGVPRGRWAHPRPKIHRGIAPSALEPWEKVILGAIFERAGADGTADWQKAASTMNRRLRDYTPAVQAGLVARGDFDPAGLEARRVLKRRLLWLLVPDVAASVAGILFLDTFGPAALLPMGAVSVLLVTLAVLVTTFPVRTRQGAERARSWKDFARYLKDASKGVSPVDAERFAAWLPHAVALGVAPQWTKAAKRRGIAPPSWFRSASGDFAADMHVLTAVIVAASASGGNAGGGGGAAGGGSSGAG